MNLKSCPLHVCTKPANTSNESNTINETAQPSSGVQKTWNQIKSHVKPRVVSRTNQNETKDKCEKRIFDVIIISLNSLID